MTDRVIHWVFLTAIAASFIFLLFLVGVTTVLAYLTWGTH